MPQSERTSELIEQARNHRETPAEVRARKRSLIRGLSGDSRNTDEKIGEILPDLRD